MAPRVKPVLASKDLPRGWAASAARPASSRDVNTLEKKAGTRIDEILVQAVSVAGLHAQLNLIRCPDEKSARAFQQFVAQARGEGFSARSGCAVVEVAKCNLIFARKLRDLLGLTPDTGRYYAVRMRLGCVDRLDHGNANRVFNLLLSHGTGKEIRGHTRDWSFGTSVALWTGQRPWFRAEYTLEPAPVREERDREVTRFIFKDPPQLHGIPYVDVTARIRVKSAYRPSGDRPSEDLLRATPRWSRESVQELAGKLAPAGATSRERVDSILEYLCSEIRSEGGGPGSRHGVPEVLRQKHGRCWDKSDVFVTLCRSSGVPARLIAGWVPALKAGHVWAEVYLEGEGALPVDPTTPWTGTSEDYIPWFSSSDGEMPMLYLAVPEIRQEPWLPHRS